MLTQTQPRLLIGFVAKQTGVPIKTIRYYEEIGLLKTSGRTEGGFRVFDLDVFNRLSFIKRSQYLGLSLAEIGEILTVHDQGSLPCDHVKVKLLEKLMEIDRQIQQLSLLKQELQTMLTTNQAATNSDAAICPVIESI